MKKLYATLFSALFLGGAICASCTDKKDAFAEEVINTIHKVNNYWQTLLNGFFNGSHIQESTDVLFGIMPPITPEIWKLIF